MRVQLLLVLALVASVHAASPRPPKPPAPTSFTCNSATASTLASTLTTQINDALLPKSSNTNTTSHSKPYYSFTVPSWCWDNVFGFGYKGCTPGGTYSGSTGQTTTITGAYNMKVNVDLTQTSCSASSGAAGTWSMTATWPKITFDSVLAIYTVTGNTIGVETEITITNMVATASGTYGYTVNGSTSQLCVTDLQSTAASVTAGGVTATLGLNGAPGTSVPKMASKIESGLAKAGPKLQTKLNDSFESTVGKCKTVGTPKPPMSPRSPAAPRPPRSAGRR